ncbi:MAG TPA: hypothetical protein VGB55_05370 [Tepidisphaeraceae bacterium]|jgi:hypothetical protein
MKLKLVRHLWGVTEPLATALPQFKAFGYEAIEAPFNASEALPELLREHQLDFIAMAFPGGVDVDAHLVALEKNLEQCAATNPIQVTVHSGSDAWSLDQMIRYYTKAAAIEKNFPFPVGHELHRGRALFSPWSTREVLQASPDTKIVCDFSHWVCVAERLNWDDEAGSILALCAERALHIHARVGYEEGPQVPDPSAPEYAHHVDCHLQWWDAMWASQKRRGMKASTVTPEFGPPGYLHTLPHTQAPVADLDKVVNWLAVKVRERFNNAR